MRWLGDLREVGLGEEDAEGVKSVEEWGENS